MILPEWALRPTDKELDGPVCEYVIARLTLTAAGVSPTGILVSAAPGKILVVQSITVNYTPGAAQTGQWFHVYQAALGATQPIAAAPANPAIAAAVQSVLSLLRSEIIIPMFVDLQAQAVFNAGVAVNTATFYLTGWLIPRSSVVI